MFANSDSQSASGYYRVLSAGLFMLLLSGCGSSLVDPPVIPVAPVTGSIKFGRDVPTGARVLLIPVSRSESGITSSGVVKADGKFAVSTYGQEDGAPPGDYVVLVQWFKPLGGSDGNTGGPNVIPRIYSSPATSPVKVTVKEGPNDLAPIQIPKS
jgi:hypothetical protein